jgi:OmpA-OmpF porin, OOP family
MKFAKSSSLQSVALIIACAWGVSSHVWAADNNEVVKNANLTMIENPLGDRSAVFERIALQQTRLIVYRPASQTQQGSATVYVNGYYHTTLIPGGYAELCMPPNKAEVGVRRVRVGDRPKDRLDTITALDLNPGQTTFMRLQVQGAGSAMLQPLPASEAQVELQATRQQIHTISRVPDAMPCIDGGSAPTSTPAVTKSQQINLAADALFAFSKSDKSSITMAGRQSLDNLISRIKGDYVTIDRINVIGHADPLGNEALNERLAKERAITVRQYFLSHGLQNTRITGQSKGSREPLVTTCSKELSPASILCNQPNRRVMVEISGVQRTN